MFAFRKGIGNLLIRFSEKQQQLYFCLRVKFILNSIFLLFIYLYLFFKYYLHQRGKSLSCVFSILFIFNVFLYTHFPFYFLLLCHFASLEVS